MGDAAQLEWEKRAGVLAAAAAFGSIALDVAKEALTATAGARRPEGERGALMTVEEHVPELVIATVTGAAAMFLAAFAVWYLYRATRHRRPETPGFPVSLLVAGPVLLAVGSTLLQVDIVGIADVFAAGAQTERRADNLLDDRSALGPSIGLAGTLAIGFAVVVVSLNAMRAGLLSRFMGILGIIVGVLFVLPFFGGPPVVRLFWLGAVGLLFLGRWPGGRGPAWETGEAIPWPQPERRPRGASEEEEAPPPGELEPPAEPERQPRKRKRKKKRR